MNHSEGSQCVLLHLLAKVDHPELTEVKATQSGKKGNRWNGKRDTETNTGILTGLGNHMIGNMCTRRIVGLISMEITDIREMIILRRRLIAETITDGMIMTGAEVEAAGRKMNTSIEKIGIAQVQGEVMIVDGQRQDHGILDCGTEIVRLVRC